MPQKFIPKSIKLYRFSNTNKKVFFHLQRLFCRKFLNNKTEKSIPSGIIFRSNYLNGSFPILKFNSPPFMISPYEIVVFAYSFPFSLTDCT